MFTSQQDLQSVPETGLSYPPPPPPDPIRSRNICLHVNIPNVGEAGGEVDQTGDHCPGRVHCESVHDHPARDAVMVRDPDYYDDAPSVR
jgi:hypothetical protein